MPCYGETKMILSKEDIFKKLYTAYNYGNLGLFIGAGFSKAVIGNQAQQALSWFELIKKTSSVLKIDFPDDESLIGVPLPELATSLCKNLAEKRNINYREAKCLFKDQICNLTNWLPDDQQIEKFREIFEILNPAWIVTTNYDLVLETLLTGRSKSLGPNNYLSSPRNIIPIYHLHGKRLDPNSIIVTQDDYIPLFRPNEYRQVKLAMTIRESTTLILGYGLNDMNVLSAVDWSKNIYTEDNEYPYEIIQVHWTSHPSDEAHVDENGNIIIETDSLENFLYELVSYIVENQREYDSTMKNLSKLVNVLESGEDKWIEKFTSERDFRIELLDLLTKFEYKIIEPYIEFLTQCIRQIWETTHEDGAFKSYDKYLNILLDIIIKYDYKKMPPKLFKLCAESINKVLHYVGDSTSTFWYGDSWSATRSWHSRKSDIPDIMKVQLYQYSINNELGNLSKRLKILIDE
jgi:hypothetical protein